MIPELPVHPRIDRLRRTGEARPAGDGAAATDAHLSAPRSHSLEAPVEEPMQVPTDRLIGLRFLKAALGRQRRLWLGAALVGLAIGLLYHQAVPLKYWATSTVYLAHPSTTAGTVAAQDDLAMLQTDAVASRALARLQDPGLTASGLLGKQPGTLLSENVLEITVSGPSPKVAVRRVDALTSAYLSYRAAQYDRQNRALVSAATAQVAKLQAEVTTLTRQIGSASGASGRLTVLEAQRTAALSQITGLEIAIQQDNLNQLAVTNGSRVLGRGALVPASKKKVLVLDGLTGLVGGLGLGLIVVVTFAMLSDRVRRREDVSAILGVPVAVSVGRVAHRRGRTGWRAPGRATAARDPELQLLVHHLRQQLRRGDLAPRALVVPVGDEHGAAVALLALSGQLAGDGAEVVLVDATERRTLARMVGRASSRLRSPAARREPSPPTVVTAPLPQDGWREGEGSSAAIAPGTTVLVLGTVDPAVGASHLRRWSHEAIVMVSAGHAGVQQLAATGELLDAAGIAIGSAVLLDAEPSDDSVGLPTRSSGPAYRSASPVQVPRPTVT